ncbi:gliding motility protein GldM [Jejudonia soesokkakensis]|uniref:Gliding motility protein GldM n=1 Tax=Jejudonia soesokkakensis TaxID=1323432 RepID=A0ABW2MV73_9FLAO
MAGGKLSARQKMINLMYLVFIAMLALNMSKEVLSAFGLLNSKISSANTATEQRNVAFMDGLATKAAEQPEQYAAVAEKAQSVSVVSEELDNYIAEVKAGILAEYEDKTEYEVMDKADYLNQKWFKGGKISPEGQAFIDKVDAYRTEMLNILPADTYPDIRSSIESNFATGEVEDSEGVKKTWLSYNYEGFPAIASVTKLTQMQADIKTTKNELLQKMLAGQQASALSFTQYNTLLEQSKSAYYSGEQFDGAIVLGRKDPNTKPNEVELTLDGRKLTESQYTIESGKVKLNIGAGAPGDHKIEGNLIFLENGERTEIPVNLAFATISKPNAAVIAADKMNVVYRGVDNPMTVSIPGIPDNKVSASGAGLSKVSGSKYVMRPQTGNTVNITASGTLPDGQRVSSSSEFRIKGIPAPAGTIRGESGRVPMQRNGLEISSVGAVLEDFDFDLGLRVTGFSFKVPNQPTVVVSGTTLNAQAKNALRSAKRGDVVSIFDINTSITGSNVKLRKTAPVFIELSN